MKIEKNLGRIFVADLQAKSASKIRQIDCKTIEWFVFKNVKYILHKGAKT